MRRTALLIAAAFMLCGCATYLESLYDGEARANCEQQVRRDVGESCHERVDRERRERRRARED